MMKIEALVAQLALQPHPEGGYYRETYRSKGEIHRSALPREYSAHRNYATGIYFLLTKGNFSAFHRVLQDEMWHFYLGAPIELFEITPQGELIVTMIGNNLAAGENLQYVVSGGNWFASRVLPGAGEYALAGCTVSPGFDFADFEMAVGADLVAQYPAHEDIIRQMTRE